MFFELPFDIQRVILNNLESDDIKNLCLLNQAANKNLEDIFIKKFKLIVNDCNVSEILRKRKLLRQYTDVKLFVSQKALRNQFPQKFCEFLKNLKNLELNFEFEFWHLERSQRAETHSHPTWRTTPMIRKHAFPSPGAAASKRNRSSEATPCAPTPGAEPEWRRTIRAARLSPIIGPP